MNDIGQNILALRTQKGWSRKELADMVEGDSSPGPEMELAKRISNLPPKKRMVLYDLIEMLEV